MQASPDDPETPGVEPTANPWYPVRHQDPEHYSHLDEVRRLRAALARLEAQLEQVPPDDPAMLVRLATAIARLSDSIVRALAAHHKLQALAEKHDLRQQWDQLVIARDIEQHKDRQYRLDRARWFREDQEYWLSRLAEAARQAASGNPTSARDVAAGLKAYIEKGDYAYSLDQAILAAALDNVEPTAPAPWPSTHDPDLPYT